MTKPTINLRDLIVLVADGSSYFSMLVHGMLRGFGTSKVIDARNAVDALRIMSSHHIDVLICDSKLPPNGGHALIRAIRRKADHDHRTVPILMMSADTRETTIKRARDAGANMVIAKPMSPINLYDRLAWIALTPRKFVDTPNYFGPDRRFKIEGYPGGVGRRSRAIRDVGTTMDAELLTFVADSLCEILDAIEAGSDWDADTLVCHLDALMLVRQPEYRGMSPDRLPELTRGLRQLAERISTAQSQA